MTLRVACCWGWYGELVQAWHVVKSMITYHLSWRYEFVGYVRTSAGLAPLKHWSLTRWLRSFLKVWNPNLSWRPSCLGKFGCTVIVGLRAVLSLVSLARPLFQSGHWTAIFLTFSNPLYDTMRWPAVLCPGCTCVGQTITNLGLPNRGSVPVLGTRGPTWLGLTAGTASGWPLRLSPRDSSDCFVFGLKAFGFEWIPVEHWWRYGQVFG